MRFSSKSENPIPSPIVYPLFASWKMCLKMNQDKPQVGSALIKSAPRVDIHDHYSESFCCEHLRARSSFPRYGSCPVLRKEVVSVRSQPPDGRAFEENSPHDRHGYHGCQGRPDQPDRRSETGTSGLRKKAAEFSSGNYLANRVQSLFSPFPARKCPAQRWSSAVMVGLTRKLLRSSSS